MILSNEVASDDQACSPLSESRTRRDGRLFHRPWLECDQRSPWHLPLPWRWLPRSHARPDAADPSAHPGASRDTESRPDPEDREIAECQTWRAAPTQEELKRRMLSCTGSVASMRSCVSTMSNIRSVIVQAGPGREGDERWAKRDAGLAQNAERHHDISCLYVPSVSRSRTWSLNDSTAEITNRHPCALRSGTECGASRGARFSR